MFTIATSNSVVCEKKDNKNVHVMSAYAYKKKQITIKFNSNGDKQKANFGHV